MTRALLYATSNSAKIAEVRKILGARGIALQAPSDFGLALDVPEPGATLEENASAKARAYLDVVDEGTVVLGDDTGVEIDALGGEPGIHVRRWAGEGRMTDQAVLETTLARLARVPLGERGAQFRTVFAVGVRGRPLALFEGTLRGVILERADPLRIAGFPFESIFYVPEWGLLLGEVHRFSAEAKARFITHRERALLTALPHITALLEGE